jgi:hypothetical protein
MQKPPDGPIPSGGQNYAGQSQVKPNRSTSRLQKRKRKSRDFLSSQEKRSPKMRSGRPGRTISTPSSGLSPARTIAMRTSGKACAVFVALESQADTNGYCWPLIATLQKLTGIKKRKTISRALREFERLGIVDRAKLVLKKRGNIAPRLCRIGGRIESLPREAAARFILPARPWGRRLGGHAIDGEKREAT